MVKEGDEEIMQEPINTRSPQQWEIISKHIDFKGKSVIDLGCGYGDILFRCWEAGARSCVGVDKNASSIASLWEKSRAINAIEVSMRFIQHDIEDLPYVEYTDLVSICFSVLPYLKDPNTVLTWMRDHSEIALIEMQFFGDGPGSNDWLKGQIKNEPSVTYLVDDEDAYLFLKSIGWQSVEMIGRTLVEGRNKERSIWLCHQQEGDSYPGGYSAKSVPEEYKKRGVY